jgi:hypothetical protein
VGLVPFALVLRDGVRGASLLRAGLVLAFALPFPLWWMLGNFRALGDPLAPFRVIDDFHRAWVGTTVSAWGEARFRLQGLVFWPAVAVATLSPLVACFGFVGLWRTARARPKERWLAWLILVPTALFTARAALLMTFVPLARFAVVQVALLLPFVGPGYAHLTRATPVTRARWTFAALALAAATWALLAALTFRREGAVADALRPIAPVSTNSRAVLAAAAWLRSLAAGEVVLLDAAPSEADLQVAFFSGLPEERLVRARWGALAQRLAWHPPTAVLRCEGGALEREASVASSGERMLLNGEAFEPVALDAGPWRAYRHIKAP